MIRQASTEDAEAIARIYNQNLDEQGFANCDLTPQTAEYRLKAMMESGDRYPTFVSTSDDGRVLGWSSLKRWSTRPDIADVAEIAIYVDRSRRGNIVGAQLLCHLLARPGRTSSGRFATMTSSWRASSIRRAWGWPSSARSGRSSASSRA
ncbi:N-acetyltransferase family protein [Sorangium sp. So ce233]|uniref:GNAT family N-acetyltransferase n=1 Tax=Sorangium sp. So ce233 TaxID=3133290 RepID=UPI003F644A91